MAAADVRPPDRGKLAREPGYRSECAGAVIAGRAASSKAEPLRRTTEAPLLARLGSGDSSESLSSVHV